MLPDPSASTRIDPDSDQGRSLIAFVRDGLGCGCPDEVFADLRVEARPQAYGELPVDSLFRIGGRLLVAVSPTAGWCGRVNGIQRRILETGRAQRDRAGFNRFRLVVAAHDVAPSDIGQFPLPDDLGLDDRVHLHVIAESQLPGFTGNPGA